MSRGNRHDVGPPPRWETVAGVTERLDANLVKVTLEGRTAAPRSARVGATTIVDDRVPGDYARKLRRIVRALEEGFVT